MKKSIIIVSFFLIYFYVFSQKEGNNWYFGGYAAISFNSGSPVALINSAMYTMYGCATISDVSGNLLFYTNGMTVWNKINVVMLNGTGLFGGSGYAATILPMPGNNRYYYIFTIAAYQNYPYGFCYSIVDITLNRGLGGITLKNVFINAPVTDKISAVKSSDNKSLWVIVHGWNSDAFYSYRLTSSGLNFNPVINHIGLVNGGSPGNSIGYMKISPNGKNIALTCNIFTELFDFDNNTGIVSNEKQLLFNNNALSGFGLEFSPNGTKLYISFLWYLYQYDISTGNINYINNSAKLIIYSFNFAHRAIQVGPDGKIYEVNGGSYYISLINNPNDTGNLCNYQSNAIYLNGKIGYNGLPTFMQSYFFIPDFKAEPLCFGDSTKFSLTNTSGIDSVFWNFDNPASGIKNHSALFNPEHKFTDTGSYNVAVIVYHSGVPDTLSRRLKISYYPTASFSVTDTSQCLNENYFTFVNNSTIPIGSMSYTWDFGDTTYAYDTAFTHHKYTWNQTFKVKLTALSDYGCESSFSKQVVVRPSPVSLFTVNDTTQCMKANKFVFTNNSSIVKNTVLIYKWYFGSGDSSTVKNPVYSYKTLDTFPIKLITTSNLGCKDTFSRTAIIYPQSNPKFSINDSTQCLTVNSFSFNNLTAPAPIISNWLWKFGDGKSDASKSTSHIYNTVNNFIVSLITTSTDGCKDTTNKNVYVYKIPDTTLNINSNIQCLKNNLFVFTAKPGSNVYNWNFGDGKTDTGRTVNHSYSGSGNYIIEYFLTNSFGCSDTGMKNVVVNPSPDATFSASDTVLCFNNNLFTFNCIQPASAYSWNLGDGNTGINKSVVHNYLSAGSFKVMLVVTNGFGCKDTSQKNIVVNPSPDGKFSVNDSSQCFKGNSFVFKNSNPLSVISNQWEFGDGKTDTGISVTHVYSDSGNYKVKLIVTNIFDCKDSSQKNIIVRPSPVAIMTINDTAQCLNQNSFFLNCPSNAVSYQWNLGDGNIISTKSVIHKYLKSDTFNVKLVVANVAGCKDSSVKNIIVFPSPNASFTVNNTSQCLNGNSFSFVISNLLSVISNLWEFGDLNNSALQNPTHTYNNAGTYNVSLIVTTKDNCTDTAFKSVIVKPNPQLPNISSNSPLCENKTLNLTANSDAGSAYQWKTDNGFTSTSQNPVISNVQLTDSGNYYVYAILNGCKSDSATTHVIIYPVPYFDLGNSKTICDGDRIILDPGFFTSYLWQDSSTQRQYNVTAPGIYSVKVSNSYGCSYEDSIEIIKKCPTTLYIPDAFSPNNDGHNDKFEIIAENIKEFDLIIFSRWGEKIFHSNDSQNSWDGTYKGSQCPVGVYYYQLYIRANDGLEKNVNGTVMIVK